MIWRRKLKIDIQQNGKKARFVKITLTKKCLMKSTKMIARKK